MLSCPRVQAYWTLDAVTVSDHEPRMIFESHLLRYSSYIHLIGPQARGLPTWPALEATVRSVRI
jgi:hypothetical protein